MNGIEEKNLTKIWLNVFKGSIYKKIVMKDLFKKNDGVWQQKKVPWRPWSFDYEKKLSIQFVENVCLKLLILH